MINTLIGQKVDQTQKFLENGKRIPVTHIAVAANSVVQVKTPEHDGYASIQLGFGNKKNAKRGVLGHSKKSGLETTPRVLREVRVEKTDDEELPQAGSFISVASVFKPGDRVAITGTTKGKGFAGVVKRHGFAGGPKTHGQSDRHRAPGSIGQGTTPGRVYKGKRMAGHMGNEIATVTNLVVVAVDEEKGILSVKGLVPGHKEGILFITKTGEEKKFVELLEVKTAREAKEAAEAEKTKIEAEKTAQEAVVEEPKREEVAEETKEEATSTTEEELKEEVKEEPAEKESASTEEASEPTETKPEEVEKEEGK